MAEGGVPSDEDDDMCEYERMRLENIRHNHDMLRNLGEGQWVWSR